MLFYNFITPHLYQESAVFLQHKTTESDAIYLTREDVELLDDPDVEMEWLPLPVPPDWSDGMNEEKESGKPDPESQIRHD